jgi:hypothetical protein
MLNLHSLGSGTVNTMLFVLIDLDEWQVVDLRMRPSTQGTAHTLGAALVGVMTPLLAPGAQKGTGMRPSPSNAAVNTAKQNKLTYEGSRIGATQGVV